MPVKPVILLTANTLSLLATLFVNYYVGSGNYSGKSIGEISSRFPVLLTPASYAFSIWGFIYLLLAAFVAYQWYAFFKGRNEESLLKAGGWFFLANIANALWVIVWVNEALGWSVLLIFSLLFTLIMMVKRLDLEIWDAPLRIIVFVWWPVGVYFGWIVLASVTNLSVFLSTFKWPADILLPEIWAIIALSVATIIYLYLTYKRNLREAALAGVWGLVAIAYRQWGANSSVAVTALLAAGILLLYTAFHGYQNKETSPFQKLVNERILKKQLPGQWTGGW